METTRNAVRTAENRPAYQWNIRQFRPAYQCSTHKYEEGVYVVRVVRDHVFVMTQDLLLDKVPSSERIPTRSLL